MAMADGAGLPLAIYVASATPNEVTLVAPTLAGRFTGVRPERLIGDKGFDSDPLDADLQTQGITFIAAHRRNRTKPKTQDGRALRRKRRRWKVERLNAWLQNARRIVVRYERDVNHYTAFIHLACTRILLKPFLK